MASLETTRIDGALIAAIWDGRDLFKSSGKRSLMLLDNGRWAPADRTFSGWDVNLNSSSSMEQLITCDVLWQNAFDAIRKGADPVWARKTCSCGAHATYGLDYPHHTNLCDINQPFKNPLMPANNDGREFCWICGEPTNASPGWTSMHNLCSNKKCSWYGK